MVGALLLLASSLLAQPSSLPPSSCDLQFLDHGAQQLDCGVTVVGNTTGAPSAHGNPSGEHFYTIPSKTDAITLSMCDGSNTFDTFLRVFRGCPNQPGATEVASNDDACAEGSRLVYTLQPGFVHYALVEGYEAREGRYALTMGCTPPSPPPPPPYVADKVRMPSLSGIGKVCVRRARISGRYYYGMACAMRSLTALGGSPSVLFYSSFEYDAIDYFECDVCTESPARPDYVRVVHASFGGNTDFRRINYRMEIDNDSFPAIGTAVDVAKHRGICATSVVIDHASTGFGCLAKATALAKGERFWYYEARYEMDHIECGFCPGVPSSFVPNESYTTYVVQRSTRSPPSPPPSAPPPPLIGDLIRLRQDQYCDQHRRVGSGRGMACAAKALAAINGVLNSKLFWFVNANDACHVCTESPRQPSSFASARGHATYRARVGFVPAAGTTVDVAQKAGRCADSVVIDDASVAFGCLEKAILASSMTAANGTRFRHYYYERVDGEAVECGFCRGAPSSFVDDQSYLTYVVQLPLPPPPPRPPRPPPPSPPPPVLGSFLRVRQDEYCNQYAYVGTFEGMACATRALSALEARGVASPPKLFYFHSASSDQCYLCTESPLKPSAFTSAPGYSTYRALIDSVPAAGLMVDVAKASGRCADAVVIDHTSVAFGCLDKATAHAAGASPFYYFEKVDAETIECGVCVGVPTGYVDDPTYRTYVVQPPAPPRPPSSPSPPPSSPPSPQVGDFVRVRQDQFCDRRVYIGSAGTQFACATRALQATGVANLNMLYYAHSPTYEQCYACVESPRPPSSYTSAPGLSTYRALVDSVPAAGTTVDVAKKAGRCADAVVIDRASVAFGCLKKATALANGTRWFYWERVDGEAAECGFCPGVPARFEDNPAYHTYVVRNASDQASAAPNLFPVPPQQPSAGGRTERNDLFVASIRGKARTIIKAIAVVSGSANSWSAAAALASFEQACTDSVGAPCIVSYVAVAKTAGMVLGFNVYQVDGEYAGASSVLAELSDASVIGAFKAAVLRETGATVEQGPAVKSHKAFAGKGGKRAGRLFN